MDSTKWSMYILGMGELDLIELLRGAESKTTRGKVHRRVRAELALVCKVKVFLPFPAGVAAHFQRVQQVRFHRQQQLGDFVFPFGGAAVRKANNLLDIFLHFVFAEGSLLRVGGRWCGQWMRMI